MWLRLNIKCKGPRTGRFCVCICVCVCFLLYVCVCVCMHWAIVCIISRILRVNSSLFSFLRTFSVARNKICRWLIAITTALYYDYTNECFLFFVFWFRRKRISQSMLRIFSSRFFIYPRATQNRKKKRNFCGPKPLVQLAPDLTLYPRFKNQQSKLAIIIT